MLNGDLSHISLRAILRLLADASLSGVVEVERGDVAHDSRSGVGARAGIVLDAGRVCVALRDLRNVRGLSARMLHDGCIDTPVLAELSAGARRDATTIAAELVRASATHDAAGPAVKAYTTETLLWIMRAAYERFRFTQTDESFDWPLPAIELEELLDAADAHETQLQSLGDPVDDLHRVCSQLPQLPGGREVSVDAEQWRLLSLIDGRRSLLEIVEVSGMGHLAAYAQVTELVDQGLVELTEPESPSTLDAMLDALDVLRPDTSAKRSGTIAVTSPVGDDGQESQGRSARSSDEGLSDDVTANARTATDGAGAAVADDADHSAGAAADPPVVAADAAVDETGAGRTNGPTADGTADDAHPADDANSALLRRLVGRRGGRP